MIIDEAGDGVVLMVFWVVLIGISTICSTSPVSVSETLSDVGSAVIVRSLFSSLLININYIYCMILMFLD
jgi:hypothetical protein